jgi:hypothetical protein
MNSDFKKISITFLDTEEKDLIQHSAIVDKLGQGESGNFEKFLSNFFHFTEKIKKPNNNGSFYSFGPKRPVSTLHLYPMYYYYFLLKIGKTSDLKIEENRTRSNTVGRPNELGKISR